MGFSTGSLATNGEINSMSKNQSLKFLVDRLGDEKYDFLNSVESKINSHISRRKGKDCLTFVERGSTGSVLRTWRPEASGDYIKCLTNFCSGSSFKGNELDSYLTDDVVKVVTQEFEVFYEKNTKEIAPILTEIIIQDKVFLESLTEQIVDFANAEIPSSIKSQVASVLVHKLEDVFDANITNSAAHAVNVVATKAVSAAVSLPIAQHTAMIILKYLTIHLKAVLAKVLASTAIKSMIAAAVKKFAAAALIATIVKIVGAKLSLSAGAAFAFVLIPALFAFIAYELVNFPKKLGAKVSEKLRSELDGSFEKINMNILEEAVSQISSAGLSGLASSIAQEPEIKEAISGLVDEIRFK